MKLGPGVHWAWKGVGRSRGRRKDAEILQKVLGLTGKQGS